ncbi:MAG: type IX secretion system membrane protein PorP/SprF [Bacteroidetes bacterium]|nr:type IX secretion system membrane protein PorP/SprF [Bacteroidota bacterium]
MSLFLLPFCAEAQQLPQLSQRMFDDLLFNPAVAGTKSEREIRLHHRSQWIGFDGPVTQVISYNGKIYKNMGLGGYFLNDITGPTRRFSMNAAYAYQVPFENFTLSFGLTFSLLQYGIDGRKVTIHENTDEVILEGVSDRAWKPDASSGIYLYNEKFYSGLSVLQLLNSKVKLNHNDYNAEIPLQNHYYLTCGYNIEIDEEFTLHPSLLVSTTVGSPVQIDMNAKVLYLKKVFGGLSYRYNDAVVLLAGMNIKDMFTISYSFDFVTSQLRKQSSGSHEIMILFTLPSEKENSTLI